MGIRERKVESYLTERIREKNGDTWKLTGTAGLPDRLCLLKKQGFFLVEVKSADGVTSSAQHRLREKMEKMGGDSYVVYGREGVDQLIDSLC